VLFGPAIVNCDVLLLGISGKAFFEQVPAEDFDFVPIG
jgi:hypothetical protein